jgi:hypothetical protein
MTALKKICGTLSPALPPHARQNNFNCSITASRTIHERQSPDGSQSPCVRVGRVRRGATTPDTSPQSTHLHVAGAVSGRQVAERRASPMGWAKCSVLSFLAD